MRSTQRPDSERASRTSGTTINSWAIVGMRNMFCIIVLGIMLGIGMHMIAPTLSFIDKAVAGLALSLLIGIILFLRSRTPKY